MLSPDSPIVTAKDDKLGRTTFAQALARALAGFSGEDSFVIGIHGKWGTGKSSLLNLIIESIEKNNESAAQAERLYPMRFNP